MTDQPVDTEPDEGHDIPADVMEQALADADKEPQQ